MEYFITGYISSSFPHIFTEAYWKCTDPVETDLLEGHLPNVHLIIASR